MTDWIRDDELGIWTRYSPTDEQRAVIQAPVDKPIRLVAGAGTGKTETITNRFVWLVVQFGLDPTRILAVTFTDRAAGELERRIAESLYRNKVSPPQGRLYIHTFHSLCSRILSHHAYDAELPGHVDVLDEVGAGVLLDRVFETEFSLSLEDGLSPDDLKEMPFDSSPELAKTVRRILNDARGLGLDPTALSSENPHSYLRVVQDRLYDVIDRFLEKPPSDGFDAILMLGALLREAGFPASDLDEISNKSPRYGKMKDLMKSVGYEYDRSSRRYEKKKKTDEIRALVQKTREKERALLHLVKRVYERYEKRVLDEGKIDFSGLIQRTVHLLSEIPDIRNEYQNELQYVLIDEFQDTSHLQGTLTRLLCRKQKNTDGPANLMLTGDKKQSIYIWRYARPKNLAELVPDGFVESGDALHFELTKNFRSGKRILSAANSLGSHLEPQDRGLSPQHEHEGEIYASKVFEVPKGVSISEARAEEARWTAETIRFLNDRNENPIPYSDTTILVRDRRRGFRLRRALQNLGIPEAEGSGTGFFEEPLARDVIAYLRVIANPHDDIALCRLLERPPICLSPRQIYLLGSAPDNERPHTRKQRHLYNGLIEVVTRRADDQTTEAVPAERVTAFTGRLRNWIRRRSLVPVGRLIEEIARDSGILSNPAADDLRAWPTVYSVLRSMARGLERAGLEENVETFVEIENLYRTSDALALPNASSTDSDGVRIMTIHQAKGLEFDACFTLGLKTPQQRSEWGLDEDWGLLSGSVRGEEPVKSTILKVFREPNDEERRITYVACTRAKRLLATSHCTRTAGELHPYADYFGDTPEEPGRLDTADKQSKNIAAFLKSFAETMPHRIPPVIETSFSTLELVAICPTRYWIGRNWNLPDWFGTDDTAEKVGFGLSAGRIFHDLVAEYYTAKWSDKPFDVNERLDSHLRSEQIPAPARHTVLAIWENFLHSEWATRSPVPYDVERDVRWTTRIAEQSLINVRGRIDLIDRDSKGKPAIKDFKTKHPITEDDLETYAVQGMLYSKALGVDNDNTVIPPSIIAVSRKGIQEYSLEPYLPNANRILEDRLQRLVEIETSPEIPEPPETAPCEQCGYWRICPSANISEKLVE